MEGYQVPERSHRVEEVVRRSRFVTTLGRARDAESAHAFISSVRDELPGATHYCWAFVAGPPGSTRQVGMSDAGEPAGTAGRPMLTALLHSGVGEIVVVCARWFGGTKLGTGGLARAYSGGVKKALEEVRTERMVERVVVRLTIPYPAVDPLLRVLRELDVLTEDEAYGSAVQYQLAVPTGKLAELEEAVASITAGEGRVEKPT